MSQPIRPRAPFVQPLGPTAPAQTSPGQSDKHENKTQLEAAGSVPAALVRTPGGVPSPLSSDETFSPVLSTMETGFLDWPHFEPARHSVAAPLESKRDSSLVDDPVPTHASVDPGGLVRSLPPFHLAPLTTSNDTLAAQSQQVQQSIQLGEPDSAVLSSGDASPQPGNPRGGQDNPAPR